MGLKARFFGVPLLALTATATAQVTRDIVEQLGMKRPTIVKTSFYRPNLRLSAHAKSGERGRGKSVQDDILRVTRSHAGKSGIVYCLSRKSTETTARFLASHGCRAEAYHAGMEPEQRTRVQDAFCRDDIDVVVATIAFGMGIDKSNVRFVVHRDMPRSIEGYYQEVGRAGRDGLPSDCIMFYSWSEVMIYERFAAQAPDAVGDRIAQQARRMFRFAESKGCRHEAILAHFGETMSACGESCERCAPNAPWAAHPRDFARAPKALPAAKDEMFERLRALRKRLADERKVPAFTILNDATLLAMAAARPSTPEALLLVPGIGPRKLERYGALMLDVLCGRA
jgi:ATP-dependent DNA helicase RecQ